MKGLSEKSKKDIIQEINYRIGNDITNLTSTLDLENELAEQRKHLQSCVHACTDEAPTKLSTVIRKTQLNTKHIESLKEKSAVMKEKVDDFIQRTEPFMGELNKRFAAMAKLEETLAYLKSYARIEELCAQMKQCKDDEQLVLLYGEMKAMCHKYNSGHRSTYIKEYTHYWHDILKENLTKHYEEHLKVLKWPLSSGAENSPLPKEVMVKFTNLTRHLFLIQEPEDVNATLPADITLDQNPSLPIRILLRPLKKRFAFHFTGPRQTARIDRPEWFLTQTLTWIKDHQGFVKNNVQPVADKLQMKNVDAVNEFNSGLIALAAERLHTVLATYHTQGSKGEMVDVDAAFAHAVDETLGFHRELITITGNEAANILSVLTKAETFVQWLTVERKYALAKMDEILDNEQWTEPVAAGVSAAVGAVLWVPRGADWFITLLKTVEDRYAALPQPGHRLQFLELQLELVEEWRVRLTQLLGAAAQDLASGAAPALPAVINAAHHTRAVLVQWAHSLHYLQLHYYRRQFQHFTQQQHRAEDLPSAIGDVLEDIGEEPEMAETMSLSEVEMQARRLALNEVTRRSSALDDAPEQLEQTEQTDAWATDRLIAEQILNVDTLGEEDLDDGAFADVSALLAHLRNAGLALLAEHIILEFKATIRDYKKQKWHAMVTVEESALCVSVALCGPLAALCARTTTAARALAPSLAARLRALLADHVDRYLYEEVVLESWFNTGGTLQLTHDVKRNLIPAFAPPKKNAQKLKILPRLQEACRILNMDYEDARRLRTALMRGAPPRGPAAIPGALPGADLAASLTIPAAEALRIVNQRTDLSDNASPSYVMELF